MNQNLPKSFIKAEEDFFNKSSVRVITSDKARCGEIHIQTGDSEESYESIEQNYVALVNNILKRIISTEVPFPGYTSGKKAIKSLTEKFKKEFKACIHPSTNTGRMLVNKDIGTVICVIAVSGIDKSTFEGAYAVEFHWKAEYFQNGEVRRKPIIHCYNSQTDRRVEC